MSETMTFQLFTFPKAAIVRGIDHKQSPLRAPSFAIYGFVSPTAHQVKVMTTAVWSPERETLQAEPILSLPATLWTCRSPYEFFGDFRFAVQEFRLHGNTPQFRLPALPNLNLDGTLCFGPGASKPDLGAAYHSFWNAPFNCEFSYRSDQHPRAFLSRSYYLPNPQHTCPSSDEELDHATCDCLSTWFREVVTPHLVNYSNKNAWQNAPFLSTLHLAPVPDAHLLFKVPKYLPTNGLDKPQQIQAEWVVLRDESREIYQSLEDGEFYTLASEGFRYRRMVHVSREEVANVPALLAPTELSPALVTASSASPSIDTPTPNTSRQKTALRQKRDAQRATSQEKTRAKVRRRPPKKENVCGA